MPRIGTGGLGGATDVIPEYPIDPVNPRAEDAWILYTPPGSPIGLLLALTYGVGQYQFSYKTIEGPIVRVPLS